MHGFATLWRLLSGTQAAGAVLLILIGLFSWAGGYKLLNPEPAAAALRDFGLVRRSRRWLGGVAGATEIAVAAALAVPATRRDGAVAAAVLAAGFTFLVARALRRGHEFPCACLGAGEPVSREGVWRAGLTLLGAVLVVRATPYGGDVVTWMQAAALASVAVGGPLLERTRRQLLRIRRQLDERLDWDWIVQAADPRAVAVAAGARGFRGWRRGRGQRHGLD